MGQPVDELIEVQGGVDDPVDGMHRGQGDGAGPDAFGHARELVIAHDVEDQGPDDGIKKLQRRLFQDGGADMGHAENADALLSHVQARVGPDVPAFGVHVQVAVFPAVGRGRHPPDGIAEEAVEKDALAAQLGAVQEKLQDLFLVHRGEHHEVIFQSGPPQSAMGAGALSPRIFTETIFVWP